jgi:hypothetical protein
MPDRGTLPRWRGNSPHSSQVGVGDGVGVDERIDVGRTEAQLASDADRQQPTVACALARTASSCGRSQRSSDARCSAMASPSGMGTAFPIWRPIAVLLPTHLKASGKPWMRAASKCVIARSSVGCK